MYAVLLIYRGALRRRIRRRLVRSRVFNNARIATRNLDLPLAIDVTPSLPSSSYCTGGFWPVHGGHTAAGFSWTFSTAHPDYFLCADKTAQSQQHPPTKLRAVTPRQGLPSHFGVATV